MSNITKAQGERAVESNKRIRDDTAERREKMATVGGFAGARIGVKVITTMVPALAGMAPIAEIGGGAFLIYKGLDSAKGSGLKLGLGLGLAVGMVDRVGDYMVTAAAKFKGGNK